MFPMLRCQIQYVDKYHKQDNLHWVSGSYVFAGCLYYRFTSFVQSSINAVICTRVSLLNQCLKLDGKKKKRRKKASHLTSRVSSVVSLISSQYGIRLSLAKLNSSGQTCCNWFLYSAGL